MPSQLIGKPESLLKQTSIQDIALPGVVAGNEGAPGVGSPTVTRSEYSGSVRVPSCTELGGTVGYSSG